ncbi:Sporulation-like domain containing protein [Methylophilaceae bacterium]
MQDYKHLYYNQQKPSKKWGRKLLAIFILVLITAIPLANSFYKNGNPLLKYTSVKSQTKTEPIAEVNIPDRFTYYEILANGETVVQDISKVDVPSSKIYIQLEAFKTADEADNFQVRMKLLDLNPKIETVFLPNKGGNWFTVRIGAVETDDELARLKLQLESNQIKFAVVTKN